MKHISIHNYKNTIRYIVTVIICLGLLVTALLPQNAIAAEDDNDIQKSPVKIGWYQSSLFQEGMSDDEAKSGYSYEFIDKVSDYNGWTYEYIYGDWTELYGKLLTGEIDVLAGVSKTKERRGLMLFPDEVMGYEHYVLYQHQGDSMDAADVDSLKGRKIGAIKDNLMTDYLEKWLEDVQADAKVVYYDSFDDRDRDFADGRIDGLVTTNNGVLRESGYSQVAEVGKESYYLAVSVNRPDLLEELNRAQSHISNIEPYFMNNLEYDNYGTTLANSTLSPDEEEWLSKHDTLNIGCLDNYLPYSEKDSDGNVRGLITDVIDAIRSELDITDRLTVNYETYASSDDLLDALKKGKIDVAFPVTGRTWKLEQDGISATNPVVTTSENLIFKGEYSEEKLSSIAVVKGNSMSKDYIESEFPKAEIVTYGSINDCLDAVLKGKVNSTIINGLRSDIVKQNRKYSSLSMERLTMTCERSIGVAKENTSLNMLLNRGLRLIGDDYGYNASYSYMSDFYKKSFSDLMADYPLPFALVIAAIIGVILMASIRDHRKNQEILKIEEEKNRAKTTFLFNMSHDIRTPMNAIIGFTDLAEKYYDNKEKCLEYIHKAQVSNRFLLSLMNDVLEMARIESGNVTLSEEACCTDRFNDMVYTVFEEEMKQKGITFTSTVDVQHHYVFCDPVKLREIHFNVISNAYKYTPEGGKVTMELKELPSEKEGYVLYQMKISDTGIGMSEDFLPHLFDEFSREKSVTENKVTGTGLGMSIVKKYVELMGGTIQVESTPGEGTEFTLSVHHRIADQDDVMKKIQPSTRSTDFVGKRILMAEDNDFNAEIAAEVLSDAGFKVERAGDGAICVKMLQEAENDYYDLILMDVQMPNMNGYEATKQIRSMKNAEKAAIPIIAMTANAFEEDRKDAFEAGMNGHLAKPIEVDKLIKMLAMVGK